MISEILTVYFSLDTRCCCSSLVDQTIAEANPTHSRRDDVSPGNDKPLEASVNVIGVLFLWHNCFFTALRSFESGSRCVPKF